jgi:hypothetical protein
MVWNLGVNGVSNANWQTTPLRMTWMNSVGATGIDISPQNNTCTVSSWKPKSPSSKTGLPSSKVLFG